MDNDNGCLIFLVLIVIMFNSCDIKNQVYDINQKIDKIERGLQ